MTAINHRQGLCFGLLSIFSFIASTIAGPVARTDTPNPLSALLTSVGDITSASPPKLSWTPKPSPQCAAINGGELQCCRATVAGDLQLIVVVAAAFGYKLNPNDVNGLDCDSNLDACPGVEICCQMTALSPLLSLYCQKY